MLMMTLTKPRISIATIRVKLAGVLPLRLDFKGNYGVAINWDDGHYADIFPFDILREIGDILQK